MSLFDSEIITKLEYLSLVSRRVFRGQLLAQRRTKQLGGGIEFADHREYVAGDDPRYVDWNVYARSGELLLKRFQEEQDLHVYFLIDASQSMQAGIPISLTMCGRSPPHSRILHWPKWIGLPFSVTPIASWKNSL